MDIDNSRGRRVPGAARRVAVAAGLVVGLAAPALAVLPAHADTTVTVSGVVTDASTGKPLQGICVTLPGLDCGDGEFSGADGSFRWSIALGEDVDSLQLTAQPREDDPFHAPLPVTATRSGSWKVDVALPGLAAVTGTVLDWNTGEPAEGMCPKTGDFSPVPKVTCSDADGVWSITRLAPADKALITLTGEGFQDTYVPGGSKQASARRFVLKANTFTTTPDTLVREEAKVVWGVDDGWSRMVALRVGNGGSELVPARRDWEWTSWDEGVPQWSVEPGTYKLGFYVGVDDECGRWDDGEDCADNPVIWYPGTFDPGAAKPVQLKTGTTWRWDRPVPNFRKRLTINVGDVPSGASVEATFFFASGARFDSSEYFSTNSSAGGTLAFTADHLPPAPLKVQFVVTMPDDTTQTFWYRGKSVADAKLVPVSADSISIKVPTP